MTRIPVGRIYHEPLSRFGRTIADGDVYIVPPWKAREIIRQQSRAGLERLVRAIECDIDELTWDLEAISDPEKAARVRRAIADLQAALSFAEERLARWERLGNRGKVAVLGGSKPTAVS
ncbi:hypothetical protein SEF58_03425 [Neomoorella humiferrea]|uniref:Uncharacterized protein n=1 Tax=Neomoorella humiferrea TaxID=676965 RepID=A0A2T0AVA8_9FIRM|nr:hypothetical protein [Moorella humiferrea]PRR74505.1 hypothetical protein MOHU_08180 [Moorella humiferrea]